MATRNEVVEWILSVKAHCGFSSCTSILAEFSSINPLPSRSSSSSSIRDVNQLNLVPLHKKWNNCKLFPSLSTPRAQSNNLGLIKIRGVYSERGLGRERGERGVGNSAGPPHVILRCVFQSHRKISRSATFFKKFGLQNRSHLSTRAGVGNEIRIDILRLTLRKMGEKEKKIAVLSSSMMVFMQCI
ncbi:hypothetical protein C1H46_002698 [Malus baccata]|uniref:Uncharacterized protein n=1 Tax=Malus baccata TaxID=106549 RepID=A0A540NKT8_MALBA|nr:hypothetical protein C1H46_002698 [Malus baccata]